MTEACRICGMRTQYLHNGLCDICTMINNETTIDDARELVDAANGDLVRFKREFGVPSVFGMVSYVVWRMHKKRLAFAQEKLSELERLAE